MKKVFTFCRRIYIIIQYLKKKNYEERRFRSMSKKYVYLFKEGNAGMKELLGGKGANLAEMANLGMPVPQGFTITTEACTKYYEDGEKINEEIVNEVFTYLTKLEEITGKKLGGLDNPLLVSVRSRSKSFNARNDGYNIKLRYE